MIETIYSELVSHQEVIKDVISNLQSEIRNFCEISLKTLENQNKLIFMGNGGSAADSQHLAAELTGRYKADRKGLPAIALTTDTSAITAIGNDFGYEYIFERQVEALANKGDLLIGISTTGNSQNIIRAFDIGKKLGCKLVGLSGKGGGLFKDICDVNIIVPSKDTARIQEMHILIGHIVCQVIDDNSNDLFQELNEQR